MTTGTWHNLKTKGNSLYGLCHYHEALENYCKSIDVLESSEKLNNSTKAELAKLYSNKSVTEVKLSLKAAGKPECAKLLEEALSDGLKCLELDSGFQKGYFRVGDALCELDRQAEAVKYVDKLLAVHRKKKSKFQDDHQLVSIMIKCKYYTHMKEKSPNWDKVKFKKNCLVVDPLGAGDLIEINADILKFNNKVSFLVHPGKYKVTKDMVIFPDREVDIVGNVKDEEEVLFYCKGKVFSPETCNIFIVGGKLSMCQVTVCQMSDHPERHAILGNMEATVELTDVKANSKCSGCVAMLNSKLIMSGCTFDEACGAVILGAGAHAEIKKCQLINNFRIGIELRDRAWAKIEDCEIINCGYQAVTSHAEANGFTMKRCTLHNNSRLLAGEPSVSVASGKVIITHSQITGSCKGGVIVHNAADATIEKCSIAGGTYGIGFSLKGTGNIKNCEIRNVHMGVAVLFNIKAKVVLEDNVMEKVGAEVTLTADDIPPKMIGKQHKVETKSEKDLNTKAFGSQIIGTERARHMDKLRPGSRYEDPRKRSLHNQRACAPCGMSQSTLGTKFMMCGGCKVAWYCSKKCQKKDWAIHKEECKRTQEMAKKTGCST